jgi:acetylornithine deacetylase/succinyl-diaminopimelate desuccinylase-like protein
MLPSDSIANVTKQLVSVLNDPEITVTQDVAPIQAPESPAPPAVKDKVEAVLHSIWPTVPVVQTMGSGYSDARQFRGAGIPTYGVGGVWIEHSENRAHGRDERVGVAAFDESVEYSYRLIKAFGQAQ